MNRLALSTAALAVSMMMGCASPAAGPEGRTEDTDSTESAITRCGDLDIDVEASCETGSKQAFTLLSFNGETITGVNGFGETISASFRANTKFKPANLNRFIPTDPILPALSDYNLAVQNGTGVFGSVENLVSFQVHARLNIKAGTVRIFRPVN